MSVAVAGDVMSALGGDDVVATTGRGEGSVCWLGGRGVAVVGSTKGSGGEELGVLS